MSLFKEIKSKCYYSNLEILNHNLSIFTFGNVSVIDRDKNVIAIKPSGLLRQGLLGFPSAGYSG